MEIPRVRNSNNKTRPLPFSSSGLRGALGTHQKRRTHFERALPQGLSVKSENHFEGNTHFGKKCLPFQKISGYFRAIKLCAQVPTWCLSSLPLSVNPRC